LPLARPSREVPAIVTMLFATLGRPGRWWDETDDLLRDRLARVLDVCLSGVPRAIEAKYGVHEIVREIRCP
jgi:hypothetical protein